MDIYWSTINHQNIKKKCDKYNKKYKIEDGNQTKENNEQNNLHQNLSSIQWLNFLQHSDLLDMALYGNYDRLGKVVYDSEMKMAVPGG